MRTRATAAAAALSQAMPVRPVRMLGAFLRASVRIPLYGLIGTAAFQLSARALGGMLGDGVLASVGSWSANTVLGLIGFFGGALIGLLATMEATLRATEAELSTWFQRLPGNDGERIFPSVPLERLRGGYDQVVDQMFDSTLGRLPLPRVARNFARSRFRHAILDEFLARCEAEGRTVVGFTEVRDYVVATGIPYATKPAHAQIGVWKLLLFGAMAGLFALPLAIAALASQVPAGTVILGSFGVAAAALLAVALPRASAHPHPANYRLGVAVLAACVVGWPFAYVQLWRFDLGLAWLVVLAATAWTLNFAVRQMVLQADRP